MRSETWSFGNRVPSFSQAASARYSVICPTCFALGGYPCRTLETRRVTDTHRTRIDKQINQYLPKNLETGA